MQRQAPDRWTRFRKRGDSRIGDETKRETLNHPRDTQLLVSLAVDWRSMTIIICNASQTGVTQLVFGHFVLQNFFCERTQTGSKQKIHQVGNVTRGSVMESSISGILRQITSQTSGACPTSNQHSQRMLQNAFDQASRLEVTHPLTFVSVMTRSR